MLTPSRVWCFGEVIYGTRPPLSNKQEAGSTPALATMEFSSHKELLEYLSEVAPFSVVLDGFDDAIIGFTSEGILVYSHVKMIENLQARGASWEDAIEYLSYNVMGAYFGKGTPFILEGEIG